jgi:hypothetical protein
LDDTQSCIENIHVDQVIVEPKIAESEAAFKRQENRSERDPREYWQGRSQTNRSTEKNRSTNEDPREYYLNSFELYLRLCQYINDEGTSEITILDRKKKVSSRRRAGSIFGLQN